MDAERLLSHGGHRVVLPKVPTVQNAGADGLPELPNLKALAGRFFASESDAESKTSAFVAKLGVIGKKEVDKLNDLKTSYDQKLKSQEKENQIFVRRNIALARESVAQQKAMNKLSTKIKDLGHLVKTRQRQLQVLEQRFLNAGEVMKSALADNADGNEMTLDTADTELSSDTEPSSDTELSSDTESQQDSEAEEAEADGPMSFLEFESEIDVSPHEGVDASDLGSIEEAASEVTKKQEAVTEVAVAKGIIDADDESMISSLKASLNGLRDGSKKSEEAMTAKFHQEFKAGAARQKALQKQMAYLVNMVKTGKDKNRKLQHAEAKLKARLATVEKNLRQGEAFVINISRVAGARIEEVPSTLKGFDSMQNQAWAAGEPEIGIETE